MLDVGRELGLPFGCAVSMGSGSRIGWKANGGVNVGAGADHDTMDDGNVGDGVCSVPRTIQPRAGQYRRGKNRKPLKWRLKMETRWMQVQSMRKLTL
jgi:hypothetical protein